MKFKIEYNDPETGEAKVRFCEFEDSTDPKITAREWAEDLAYSVADKGRYAVTEVPA